MASERTHNPIDASIHTVRGQSIMLDSDLGKVYEVETGALNRAVERNIRRFPEEFSFRLEQAEWENLKCQIGISRSWGGRRSSLGFSPSMEPSCWPRS